MKKGLLITFYFPPLNSVASHRMYSFVKYINQSGEIELDVACPDWKGDLDLDLTGINKIKLPEQKFDLNYGYEKPKGWRILKDIFLNRIFKYNYFVASKRHRFFLDALSVLEKENLDKYDFFITSYGPLDTLHIGHYLKEKYPGKKWIIDFRDLYSEMEYYNFGIFRPVFRKIERKICRTADGFVTVSEVLRKTQERLLGMKGEVVYNGFDLYAVQPDSEFNSILFNLGNSVISYTGSLYGGERDVIPFLEFVKRTKLDQKYSLVFALINDPDEKYLRECMEKTTVKNIIILRNLNFNQSVMLQNYSKALLMFANFGGRGNGYLTGKIFEYIGAGKPVIYSGTAARDYELYHLIVSYGVGESFDRFDFSFPEKYAGDNIHFFSRKNQTEKLVSYLNTQFDK